MPHRVTREEAIERISQVARKGAGRTTFVGIDGPGGAGKSTLARDAIAGLDRAAVVAVDDFAGPKLPEWDWVRFEADVACPLRSGRAARYQVWDWNADAPGSWRDIAPGGMVVVEGVSSTRHEVLLPWSLTVWVDAPRELRLARALARDGAAMLPVWVDRWMPSEDAYIAAHRPAERVDLLVDGF